MGDEESMIEQQWGKIRHIQQIKGMLRSNKIKAGGIGDTHTEYMPILSAGGKGNIDCFLFSTKYYYYCTYAHFFVKFVLKCFLCVKEN